MSAGRIADDHNVRGGHLSAELILEALANDRHQAVSIAVVGSVAAQLERHVLVETGAGELEPSDRLEIAGQQRLAHAESLQPSECFWHAWQDPQVQRQLVALLLQE